jgi:hypothetical protein
MKVAFSEQIFEKYKLTNLIKIRKVVAELFYTDGRTHRHDEASIRFSQFCVRA